MSFVKSSFIAWLLLLPAFGCGEAPTSPEDSARADDKVMEVLDGYNPFYQRNAEGRIVKLNLEGRHVTPSALAEAGKLSELRALSLYHATLTDESLAAIKELRKLQSLGLGATPITDRGLVHLEEFDELRHIWLPKASVTSAGADKLKKALPGLSIHFQ